MSKASKPKSEYTIQTVSNALRVLAVFHDTAEVGVSELARRLELHKNNVFRLLATLESHGYIEQSSASDRYRLGPACLALGRAFLHRVDLVELARPSLRELSDELSEATHLGVLRGDEVVLLDGQPAQHVVQGLLGVGTRVPLHCTALGKLLLGCGSEELRRGFDEAIHRRGALEARTDATITDRDKLFEHLRTVGVQGFALGLEEYETGLCCAAAPVFDAEGELVAALSVSGPVFRLDEGALLDGAVDRLIAASQRLSRALGYAA